jgi:Flp pilus assembly protein TadG
MHAISKNAARELCRLHRAEAGGVMQLFAFAFPVLVLLTGLGVDSAGFYNQQSRMQSAADSSALAIAKEMHLYLDKTSALVEFGNSRVEAVLGAVGLAGHPHTTNIQVDTKQGRATVAISMATKTFLPVEVWGENPIVVNAVASTYGAEDLCVLGLKKSSEETVKADKAAVITAPDCAVQSNSTDPQGLTAAPLSSIVSSLTCTSGGYSGPSTSFTPTPETDCPVLEDPLADRVPPQPGGCDYLDFVADQGVTTIEPGNYCGGLKVSNKADVIAAPGVYIISGGMLEVANNAKFHGEHVSFYFADDAATLRFKDRADVELSAPTDGLMAGILFFENPKATPGRDFEIASDSVRKLLGTIYLPRGVFKGDGQAIGTMATNTVNGITQAAGAGALLPTIGQASAYTVIVANRLDLRAVNLVINADYATSDVPVPEGVGPNSQKVRLSR